MAERIGKAVQTGGRYCVVGAPNNQSCRNTSYTPGITMHQFPLDPKIRSQWVKFVQHHRVDFGEPLTNTLLHVRLTLNRVVSLCDFGFRYKGRKRQSGIKSLLKDRFRQGPQFSHQLIKSQQIVEKDSYSVTHNGGMS
ncbi:uncharacterized protein LOC122959630 isoform X1 [Acropora millepora]|uniref:uncharacterized protein LOC122959630 isoform X1 n=1 Tax=Acropora millepora TaxID=45264 RepID=UPI001CF572D2|nr:uncharacterized protein LOC122959630 isoform X1 [Acropora millepora]